MLAMPSCMICSHATRRPPPLLTLQSAEVEVLLHWVLQLLRQYTNRGAAAGAAAAATGSLADQAKAEQACGGRVCVGGGRGGDAGTGQEGVGAEQAAGMRQVRYGGK